MSCTIDKFIAPCCAHGRYWLVALLTWYVSRTSVLGIRPNFSVTEFVVLNNSFQLLVDGGTAGIFWSYCWAILGQLFIVLSLAETLFKAPIAGRLTAKSPSSVAVYRADRRDQAVPLGQRICLGKVSEDPQLCLRLARPSLLAVVNFLEIDHRSPAPDGLSLNPRTQILSLRTGILLCWA